MLKLCIYLLALATCAVNSAKILIVFPMASPSHFILGNGLARGLLEAGHHVTMVAPMSDQKLLDKYGDKYAEFILTGFRELHEELMKNVDLLGDSKVTNPLSMWSMMAEFVIQTTNRTVLHENFQKLLTSGQNFDAVILEEFHTSALKLLALHYDAPLILFSTMGASSWVNDFFANPAPISYVPDLLSSFSSHMTFLQRVANSLFFVIQRFMFHCLTLPGHREIAQKNFQDIALDDILYNASIIFLNSHPSTSSPVPHVPSMIEIGGFHIQPPQELPQDLKEFLDNAKEGVVYFSLGSNVKSADIPLVKRDAIVQTLSKLKQKVIWKFEDDSLSSDLPPNVMIKKWLPQQDILAHENVKLFITHGGLLSTTETIYHGVPALAIPVGADQNLNAQHIVNNGFGLAVSYDELNEKNFAENLNEVLNNPKYAENAKRRSMIFHDRIATPMETAVYWVEYVIRHRGAPHLRVAGLDLPWYKYLLLDVVLFFVVLAAVSLFIFHRIIRRLKNKFCGCSKNKKEKKVKTN